LKGPRPGPLVDGGELIPGYPSPACDHAPIARFIITIEGPGWTDVEDIELPRLPDVGESIETKFGTMLVAQAEEAPDLAAYAGRIVVRFS
jgi:hypothetical protein